MPTTPFPETASTIPIPSPESRQPRQPSLPRVAGRMKPERRPREEKGAGLRTSPWGMTERAGARPGDASRPRRRRRRSSSRLSLSSELRASTLVISRLLGERRLPTRKEKGPHRQTVDTKWGLKVGYSKLPSAGGASSDRGLKKGLPLPFAPSCFLPPIRVLGHAVTLAKRRSI